MATIRRWYVYLVCLFSLQFVVNAVSRLVGQVLQALTGAARLEIDTLAFSLAVIVVGGPIFAGHWLWARALVRRDPAELNAGLRRVYLYVTAGLLMGLMAFALYDSMWNLGELLALLPGDARDRILMRLSGAISGTLVFALLGAAWFYHDRLLNDARLTQTPATRGFRQAYVLAFAGAGLLVLAVGFYELLTWLFARLGGRDPTTLPEAAAGLAAGGALWLYHEWAHRPTAQENAARVLRWLYAAGASGLAVLLGAIGLVDTQTWLFDRLAGERGPFLPEALALLLTALPVLVYHERAGGRALVPAVQPLRWLYAYAWSIGGVSAGLLGLFYALEWVFSVATSLRPEVPDAAAWLVPGLLVWAYHQAALKRVEGPLGLGEAPGRPFARFARLLRRWYALGLSGAGVSLAALGLIGLQEWVYTGFGRGSWLTLPAALAFLVTGVPAWLYFWRWAGRLFASGTPDERASDLRKAYLYIVIYIAVNTAIVTAGLLANGILRSVVGLPTSGRGGLTISIIVAAAGIWAYHALVLRGDIARAGESALQAGMQRLYWYLVATLGLAAFLAGLGGVLSVFIRWAALGFGAADAALREQFAGFTAALVAGLPVWLVAWVPARAVAAQSSPAGARSRRSVLRKAYLYSFSLAAVLVTLGGSITVVYQLLNALLGEAGDRNVIADVAQSIGFTLISIAVWVYHVWELRGDGRRERLDAQAQAEREAQEREATQAQLAAQWADYPVAVADEGDGAFGARTLALLQAELPHLHLVPVGLTPEASAAMGAAPVEDAGALLAQARLIVAPWTALVAYEALRASPAPKVVAPVDAPGIHWAGLAIKEGDGSHIVRAVQRALEAMPAPEAA